MVFGVFFGEFVIGFVGVFFVYVVVIGDIVVIVILLVGFIGLFIVFIGMFKINDWNLYFLILGLVNFILIVFGKNLYCVIMIIVFGVVGLVLVVVGIFG